MVKIIFWILLNNILFVLVYFFLLFKKNKIKKYSFIYPDRWELSEDNALFMHKFCLQNNKNIKIVCFKNKKNIELLIKHNIPFENVEWFGSLSFVVRSFFVKNSYYSHSYHHCFPTYLKFKSLKSTNYYFITHGIYFLKTHNKGDSNFTFEKSKIIFNNLVNYDDVFPTQDRNKKVIKSCLFNSYFLNKEFSQNGKIVYMPTWTECNYKQFLKSDTLKQLLFLNELGIEFDVVPHKYLRKKLLKFLKNNQNIKINIVNISQYEAIKEYSTCYTDNSSVAMEFLFLNKKVYLINKFSNKNRFSKYRLEFMDGDIVEMKGIQFVKELDSSWI